MESLPSPEQQKSPRFDIRGVTTCVGKHQDGFSGKEWQFNEPENLLPEVTMVMMMKQFFQFLQDTHNPTGCSATPYITVIGIDQSTMEMESLDEG